MHTSIRARAQTYSYRHQESTVEWKKSICVASAFLAIFCSADHAHGNSSVFDDPYLWLEDVHAQRAVNWVEAQNAATRKRFADNAQFAQMRSRLQEVLETDAHIPYVTRMGEHLYNFWRDKAHPRGIWRRTTLAEYRNANPAWETLLDIDALNAVENKHWVYEGADCLEPAYKRCLIRLSPDGGDAVEVREFDVENRTFVKDGFHLAAAKSSVDWIDDAHIYVSTDFGAGSLTTSAYPRIVKRWARGTPLTAAETVFEAKPDDVSAAGGRYRTPGFERDFVYVYRDFFHVDVYLLKDGKPVRIDTPADAGLSTFREWLLVELRKPWKVGGKTYPAGALIATKFDDFVAGKRDFATLFTPTEHVALSSYSWTRHHLILNLLDDVKSRLETVTLQADGRWTHETVPGVPTFASVNMYGGDPEHSDEYWLSSDGFLQPATFSRGVIGEGALERLKQAPAQFDASKFEASQHFVTSEDGTRIPYFEIAPKDIKLDGSRRTLLYGYGGFEISMLPHYNGLLGRAWLERGGVYVLANIRGGGEYGPQWHLGAMRENSHRVYEDFAAVAQDLIKRGVTSPAHLGAQGDSKGGLLVGNMLTQYPQLFGAIACGVPLLDMKRYTHLSAGASWIAEYGDPDKPEDWAFIKTFSPYHSLKSDVRYPPVLFYTATSDDRVGPVQARKMAAKMQGMGNESAWFFENTEGGHGGSADYGQAAFRYALTYGFLWDELR
jgi:prolyl oligopeptidase